MIPWIRSLGTYDFQTPTPPTPYPVKILRNFNTQYHLLPKFSGRFAPYFYPFPCVLLSKIVWRFAPHSLVFSRKMCFTKLIQLPQNQPICYPFTILNSNSKFRKTSTVLIKINFCTLSSVCSSRLCMLSNTIHYYKNWNFRCGNLPSFNLKVLLMILATDI